MPLSPPLPQWDKVENKTSVIVYGAGGIVVLWLAATIVGALNNIPLVRGWVSVLLLLCCPVRMPPAQLLRAVCAPFGIGPAPRRLQHAE